MSNNKIKNFEDAFEALDRAANQQRFEQNTKLIFQGAVTTMQNNLKTKAQQVQDEIVHKAHEARDKVIDITKHAAKDVEVQIRKKPWHFLGIAAIFSAI